LVVAIAVGLNWKNSPVGFWLNLVIVSAVDLDLIIFLIAPGFMALPDGLIGIMLPIPAVAFANHIQPLFGWESKGGVKP
jgi:hypothetical protein